MYVLVSYTKWYGSGPSPKNSTSSCDSCSFVVIDIFFIPRVRCLVVGSPRLNVTLSTMSSTRQVGFHVECETYTHSSLIHKFMVSATSNVLNEESSGYPSYRHSNIRQSFSPLLQIAEIGIVLFVFITSRYCQWNIQFLFQALELC